MSHDHGRRAACGIAIRILRFHFDYSYDSTRRDGHGRWLWRLVRRLYIGLENRGASHRAEGTEVLGPLTLGGAHRGKHSNSDLAHPFSGASHSGQPESNQPKLRREIFRAKLPFLVDKLAA